MSNDDGLSDDELNSLLADLEGRAGTSSGGGGGKSGGEADDEDIEAFLADLEGEEDGGGGGGSKKSTASAKATQKTAQKTAQKAEAGPDLSDLGLDDQVPAKQEDKGGKPAAPGGDEGRKGEQTGGGKGGGKALGYALVAGKWLAYALPVGLLWWVVGAYLAQWVSAGWLIFLVAGVFTFGVPFGAYRASKNRGKFRWWLAGASVLMLLALTLPMTEAAGEVMVSYGHWPSTTVADMAGWEQSTLVDINAGAGEWVGRRLNPLLEDSATQLELGGTSPLTL